MIHCDLHDLIMDTEDTVLPVIDSFSRKVAGWRYHPWSAVVIHDRLHRIVIGDIIIA